MSPRSPEESTEEDLQNKVLQAIQDAINEDKNTPVAPVEQDVAAPDTGADQKLDTKVELDRVETYLKGPTVFAA